MSIKDGIDINLYIHNDIVPEIKISIAGTRKSMPELPISRSKRMVEQYKLTETQVEILSYTRTIADYYETVVCRCCLYPAKNEEDTFYKVAKLAADFIINDILSYANTHSLPRVNNGCEDDIAFISAIGFSKLLNLVLSDTITLKTAKKAFVVMANDDKSTEIALEEINTSSKKTIAEMAETEKFVESWCDKIISEFPDQVSEYSNGKTALLGFFIGKVMKLSGGKADAKEVQKIMLSNLLIIRQNFGEPCE